MLNEKEMWDAINAEMPDASWEEKYAEFKMRFAIEQIKEHQAAMLPFEDKQMASLNRIEALLSLKFGLIPADSLPEPPKE